MRFNVCFLLSGEADVGLREDEAQCLEGKTYEEGEVLFAGLKEK